MQIITEQQIKTIAKEIVKLSKQNTLLKHSSVLEVISKSLGYRDYNALNAVLKKENSSSFTNKKDNNLSENFEMDKILVVINDIKHKLKIEEKILSNKELQSLRQELKAQRLNYAKASNRYELSKVEVKVEKKTKEILAGKVCPNCNGEGGWEISASSTVEDMMWYDDGEFFTLVRKECFWCSGTGKITSRRIKEVKKMKRESSYPQ